LIKKPDLAAAIVDLDKVIRLSPYNSYAYFNRALLYYEKNEKEDAVRDLSAVIKLNPHHVTSYYYRGVILSEMKEYREALEDLDKAISLYADNPDAWYARSEVKSHLKDLAGAQKDYQTAREVAAKDPVYPEKLTDETKAYLKDLSKMSGDFEEMNTTASKFQNQVVDIRLQEMYSIFTALASFDQIRFYDTYGKPYYPSHIISLTNKTGLASDSLYLWQIETESCRLESGRDTLDALFKRAIAYSNLQKYNQALTDYDSILKIDSMYVLAWFSRAVNRYQLIRLLCSLNDYQDQITIGRSNSGLRDQVVNENAGQTYAMVADDLTKAVSLDPGFYFAYYNRGYVYCSMGEYGKAIEDFTSALQCNANFAEALYNRGLIYILINETVKAREDLSRAGELGITDAYKVIKRYCYK